MSAIAIAIVVASCRKLEGTVVWEIFVCKNFVQGNFRTTPFVRKFFKTSFYCLKIFVHFIRKEQGLTEEFGKDCCIRGYHVYGYHVYKKRWREAIGKELECDREPENLCDRYAVCVKRSVVIIGHLPRKLSRVCSLFLKAWRCNITYGDWRAHV